MIAAPPRLLLPRRAVDVAALLTSPTTPARPLAGGTDLLVQRRAGLDASVLVDLTGLTDAPPVLTRAADGRALTLSALAPLSSVAGALDGDAPALRAAIGEFASSTIRNRATIGGNLVTGSPAADTVPALLVADAVVHVATPDGAGRSVPLPAFLLGPRRVDLGPGEWVTSVTLRRDGGPQPDGGFRKIGGRRAQAISLLNLAWRWRREPDGRLTGVRLAMGAVAPTVVRLPTAEALLEGQVPTSALVAAAAAAVDADISPIDDLRASAAYRRRCGAGLLREALEATTDPTTREKDL